jgi:hypothetical protein
VLEQYYLGKKATDCNNMPDEGIVVKIDGAPEAYKLKDPQFILGESKAFEDGEDDLEEDS